MKNFEKLGGEKQKNAKKKQKKLQNCKQMKMK